MPKHPPDSRLIAFRVSYNTHKYADCSDRPRSASRIVRAETADAAREILCAMRAAGTRIGERTIGLVFDAVSTN